MTDPLIACAAALDLPAESVELRNCATVMNGVFQSCAGRLPKRTELKKRLMKDYRAKYFASGIGGWLAWLAVKFLVGRIFDWLIGDMIRRKFDI